MINQKCCKKNHIISIKICRPFESASFGTIEVKIISFRVKKSQIETLLNNLQENSKI